MKQLIFLLIGALGLSGCANNPLYDNPLVSDAQVSDTTKAGRILEALPAPNRQLAVVVYDFQDQTGQLKQNTAYADYSSAVTKGGLSVLMKALLDTGDGKWFMVAERGGLNELLKERQIIRAMRADYTLPDGKKLGDLPPLVYGGMMLEGGIVFYDSNVLTGGAAAGYFGLTSSAQYNRDIVSVYLRAVDINSGRVVLSVNSSKTVFSYAVSAGVTRYLSFDKLLEAETGFTVTEPSQFAVRQAIETAVYSLVMEGAARHLWGFQDEPAGQKALAAYFDRKGGPQDAAKDGAKITAAAPPTVVAHERLASASPAAAGGGMLSWLGRQLD